MSGLIDKFKKWWSELDNYGKVIFVLTSILTVVFWVALFSDGDSLRKWRVEEGLYNLILLFFIVSPIFIFMAVAIAMIPVFLVIELTIRLFSTKAQRRARSYKRYMSSQSWKDLKSRKLGYNTICECCGEEATVIHHLSYDRLWSENDDDLVCLCKSCHYKCHFEDGEKIPLDEDSLRDRFEEVKYPPIPPDWD